MCNLQFNKRGNRWPLAAIHEIHTVFAIPWQKNFSLQGTRGYQCARRSLVPHFSNGTNSDGGVSHPPISHPNEKRKARIFPKWKPHTRTPLKKVTGKSSLKSSGKKSDWQILPIGTRGAWLASRPPPWGRLNPRRRHRHQAREGDADGILWP